MWCPGCSRSRVFISTRVVWSGVVRFGMVRCGVMKACVVLRLHPAHHNLCTSSRRVQSERKYLAETMLPMVRTLYRQQVHLTPLPRIQSSSFLPLEPFPPDAGPSRIRSSHNSLQPESSPLPKPQTMNPQSQPLNPTPQTTAAPVHRVPHESRVTHALTHSRTQHSLTHSLTHSRTRSRTHSLTHALNGRCSRASCST